MGINVYPVVSAETLPLADAAAIQLLTNSDATSLNNFFAQDKNKIGLVTLVAGPHWASLEWRNTTMSRIISSPNALNTLVDSRAAMTAIASSSVSMSAIAASQTAMTAVAAKQTAMEPIAANSIAMTPIVANAAAMNTIATSQTAMRAVFGTSVARLLMYDSSIAEKAFRDNGSAMSFISSTFGTNVSAGGNANVWSVQSTQRVFCISANVGWVVGSGSRGARFFRHITDGVTSSSMLAANSPFNGDGNYPICAGRMFNRLELLTHDGTTNATTRSARIVIME